ncbi:MAG: HEAT repeat domain-containing protein [Bryobacteraceae bacterium]|nr:HEAT repeat domain-containing protein [Bryobacteraceae bacterium]
MNCEKVRELIPLYLYGELAFDEEERLEEHLSACPACASERARCEKLTALLAQGEAVLSAELLSRCRRDLATALEKERRGRGLAARWRALWSKWLSAPPAWFRPVGAVALVALGFFGARLLPEDLAWPGRSAQAQPVVGRVRLIDTAPGGIVRVQYEEVRPRELRGSFEDERIRRLLLAAAMDPTDPGLRVESIDLLKDRTADAEVRRALIDALRSDDNPAVRLKAIEALRPYAHEPETRKALAQVLLADTHAGVRIAAVELLANVKEPDVAGAFQQLLHREEDQYIRQRTLKALDEMKASYGTF